MKFVVKDLRFLLIHRHMTNPKMLTSSIFGISATPVLIRLQDFMVQSVKNMQLHVVEWQHANKSIASSWFTCAPFALKSNCIRLQYKRQAQQKEVINCNFKLLTMSLLDMQVHYTKQWGLCYFSSTGMCS